MATSQQARPQQAPPVLTPFARKYGKGPDALNVPGNPVTIKSGLTPLLPVTTNLSWAAQRTRDDLESYQRSQMKGFTFQELIDLEVIRLDMFSINALDNPIHELLTRDKWTAKSNFPTLMEDGLTPWSGQSPLVWRALEPCLRITSMLLDRICTNPWFDAYMLGPRSYVDSSRMDAVTLASGDAEHHNLKTFYPRPPHPDNEATCKAEFDRILRSPEMRMSRWGIKDGFIDQDNPDPAPKKLTEPNQASTFCVDLNRRGPVFGTVKCLVASQLISPLLRTDLNTTEQLGAQVLLGRTVFHEIMHVIGWARVYANIGAKHNRLPTTKELNEPYFMDESVKEAGFSAENAIFNGCIEAIRLDPYSGPHPAFYHSSYPDPDLAPKPHISPPMPIVDIAAPLTSEYMKALHSKDFWTIRWTGFRDVKPPPTSIVTVKRVYEDDTKWVKFTKQGTYSLYSYETLPSSKAIDKLLGLNSFQRSQYGLLREVELEDSLKKYLAESDKHVYNSIACNELCERAAGKSRYKSRLDDLLEELGDLLSCQEKAVGVLQELERNGVDQSTQKQQTYHRNREARRVLSVTGGMTAAQATIFQSLSDRLDTMRLDLTKTEALPQGIDPTQEQAEIQACDLEDQTIASNLRTLYEAGPASHGECQRQCALLRIRLGSRAMYHAKAGILLAILNTSSPNQTRLDMVISGRLTLGALTIPPAEEAAEAGELRAYKALARTIRGQLDAAIKLGKPLSECGFGGGHANPPTNPPNP